MKIQSVHPFESFACYLGFNKRLGRWQVCLVGFNGYRKTILYSKFLMSVKEGRILKSYEQVDHINNDKTDDRLENLQILTEQKNKEKHSLTTSRNIVVLNCPYCKTRFTREKRKTHLIKGGDKTFCSRSCAAKFQFM